MLNNEKENSINIAELAAKIPQFVLYKTLKEVGLHSIAFSPEDSRNL